MVVESKMNITESLHIEFQLKKIFLQEKIRMIDVIVAKELFEKWIEINDYIPSKVNNNYGNILDEEPNYQK